MQPYVVKKVVDDSGRVVEVKKPRMVRRVLSARTCETVRQLLEGVVSEEGTAPQAAINGFKAAGKTGTSQKVDPETRRYSRTKYVAVFVGFVPADRPKLVILAMVDEPKGVVYGGLVAGPVFSEVGLWALNYLRVNPQIRSADNLEVLLGSSTGPSSSRPYKSDAVRSLSSALKAEAGLVPDFRGLTIREVLKEGRELGLKVAVEGTGVAFRQEPQPGASLEKVPGVKVSFRPPT